MSKTRKRTITAAALMMLALGLVVSLASYIQTTRASIKELSETRDPDGLVFRGYRLNHQVAHQAGNGGAVFAWNSADNIPVHAYAHDAETHDAYSGDDAEGPTEGSSSDAGTQGDEPAPSGTQPQSGNHPQQSGEEPPPLVRLSYYRWGGAGGRGGFGGGGGGSHNSGSNDSEHGESAPQPDGPANLNPPASSGQSGPPPHEDGPNDPPEPKDNTPPNEDAKGPGTNDGAPNEPTTPNDNTPPKDDPKAPGTNDGGPTPPPGDGPNDTPGNPEGPDETPGEPGHPADPPKHDEPVTVPEPGTLALLGAALAAMGLRRRRRD